MVNRREFLRNAGTGLIGLSLIKAFTKECFSNKESLKSPPQTAPASESAGVPLITDWSSCKNAKWSDRPVVLRNFTMADAEAALRELRRGR